MAMADGPAAVETAATSITAAQGTGIGAVLIGALWAGVKYLPRVLRFRNGKTARERELEKEVQTLEEARRMESIQRIIHDEGELTRKEIRDGFGGLQGLLQQVLVQR